MHCCLQKVKIDSNGPDTVPDSALRVLSVIILTMVNECCPASLVDHQCDPYVFDTSHSEDLLRLNSERTFVEDGQLQIKLIEVGNKGMSLMEQTSRGLPADDVPADWVFQTASDLHAYLKRTPFKGTRIL
jgi:hypothetical protein